MKINCTYELNNVSGFRNRRGSDGINTYMADKIVELGGTVRPLQIDAEGDVVRWMYGDGTVEIIDENLRFIDHSEFVYFKKVKEGYEEDFEQEFMTVSFTVKTREQVKIAIKMLKEMI